MKSKIGHKFQRLILQGCHFGKIKKSTPSMNGFFVGCICVTGHEKMTSSISQLASQSPIKECKKMSWEGGAANFTNNMNT